MNTSAALSTVLSLLVLLPSSSAQINNYLWFNNGQINIGQFGAGSNPAFTIPSSLNLKSENMEPMIPASTIVNKPSVDNTNWIIKLGKNINCLNGDSKENYPNWCFLNRDNPNGYFPSNGYSSSNYPDGASAIEKPLNIFNIYFNIMSPNGGYPDENYPNKANDNEKHLNGQNLTIATLNVVPHKEASSNKGYPNGTNNNGGYLNGQNLNTVSLNVVPQNGSNPNGFNNNSENLNKRNLNIIFPNVVSHNGSNSMEWNSNGSYSSDVHPIEISPNRSSPHPEISSLNNLNNGIGQNLSIDASDVNDGIPGINKTQQDRGQCRDDEFRCGSNECVPSNVKCDNKADCSDSSDEAFCITEGDQENGCALPEQPTGGRYKLGECDELCRKQPGDIVPQHSILTYTCNDDYALESSNITICVNNIWKHQISCLKICPPLNSTNVYISCNYRGEEVSCSEPILPGTQATLTCKPFYRFSVTTLSNSWMKCLDSGIWDINMFDCVPVCGVIISQTTLQPLSIGNGFRPAVGSFPWHVGIYVKDGAKTYKNICGGSLITKNLVISAAHCFYDEIENKLYNASNYAVAAGKYYRSWDAPERYSQKSMVEYVKLPSDYFGTSGNLAEDIALVKLQTSFVFNMYVVPICVDWRNKHDHQQLREGQSGMLAGWGKDTTGKPTEDLFAVNMPYVERQTCRDNVPVEFRGFLTFDKFCAGLMNGSSACDGDSGGGLCFERYGTWYLRGVVSVSPQEDNHCDLYSYVAFTRVNAYVEWLITSIHDIISTSKSKHLQGVAVANQHAGEIKL
ncbi:modular serine protease isoform X2 [Harpegnathos saltator]|uniref:modular serine protease isoform X2 n=1 Tax=Harpegnathos saltator TaxID=610380 RepID=UPI000DBED407|nr:modular serine protease isoform X2 [Harpegnathos saltator]